MEPGGIPLSLHNLWVALLMLAMFAWFLQVLYRIFKAQIIHWRMRRSERGLLLDRMSIYATDLQHIIRQHFNQLLRIRPSVPAREIAQLYVLAHLHPESLRSEIVDGEKLRLCFRVDSLQPFRVQLFWGRCHCDELIQQLTQEDNQDSQAPWTGRPSGVATPAGCGQEISLVEDLSTIKTSLDEEASADRIPLVICLWTASEVTQMLTFAELQASSVEVMQQVVLTRGVPRKLMGIFGMEGEDVECMVCFDRRRNVIVLPCRHCSVCLPCLRSMRDERCPLCRSTFSAYLLLPLRTGPRPLE